MTPDGDDQTRAIRVWMRETMARNGWSAERWARLAGTSPTTISRFLRGGPHTPSTRTLGRLSQAAGSRPALDRATPRLAAPAAGPAHPAGLSPRAFLWRAAEDCAPAGVSAGDQLWVEPAAVLPPEEGCVALVGDGGGFRIGVARGGWVRLPGRDGAPDDLAPLTAVVAVALHLHRRLRPFAA